jgi:hypothetical protein
MPDPSQENESKQDDKINLDDIRAGVIVDVIWDNKDVVTSLRAVRKNAEAEAQKAIDWYWRKKPRKSRPSRAIQLSALVLTAAAGILPVVVQIAKNVNPTRVSPTFDSGAVATLCVGLAASLLGLDKAFGFSTGFTRYVLAATAMTKLLQEFRLDWVGMVAASAATPTVEEQTKLIQRAKDFVSAIQSTVIQETKDWATEFQSNIALMEKDLKAQLDSLKAQVDQAIKDKESAAKPGSIELTLTNADKTDGFHFDVSLEGTTDKFTDSVSNSKVWTRIRIPPGQYRLSVDAKVNGIALATSMILDVKPAETSKPTLALPIA